MYGVSSEQPFYRRAWAVNLTIRIPLEPQEPELREVRVEQLFHFSRRKRTSEVSFQVLARTHERDPTLGGDFLCPNSPSLAEQLPQGGSDSNTDSEPTNHHGADRCGAGACDRS